MVRVITRFKDGLVLPIITTLIYVLLCLIVHGEVPMLHVFDYINIVPSVHSHWHDWHGGVLRGRNEGDMCVHPNH